MLKLSAGYLISVVSDSVLIGVLEIIPYVFITSNHGTKMIECVPVRIIQHE
jgi:hypothetical protein